jgi:glycosyltransferase involved in cell wall biosynthesis
MKITVILCTYNRRRSLPMALASLAAQVLPNGIEWETLIIDNNSTDDTRNIAEEYCRKFPGRFRYVFEAQQGKSHALNRGIHEASGEVIAFIDDDVTAAPDWLQRLAAPLQNPVYAGVGGRIVPPVGFTAPRWLALDGPFELGGILALFDRGAHGADLHEAPFGTNMAFRKQIFERYGLFRADLGPCPGSEIRGEDTEFGRRLLKGGERLWYESSAVVHHAVPANRLKKQYFLQFLYDHGRASVREKAVQPPILFIPRLYFTLPKIAFTSLLGRSVAWLCSIDPQHRFQRKCMVWMNVGQLVEIFHSLSERGPGKNNRPPAIINSKENRA